MFQMATALGQALSSFYSKVVENRVLSKIEKYIVTKNLCVSTVNYYCSLENCKFQILLIGLSFYQILQRLGNFHFTYQIIDCLYTLYKYRFYSKVISSTWPRCSSQFEQKKFQVLQRKDCYAKKFKRHYLCSNQKLASTQTIGSAFLERVRKVQTQNMNMICQK